RLESFRKVLQSNEILPSFDRNVFESIIDKVIVGDPSDPYQLTFVYKTGFHNSVQGRSKMHKQIQKKSLKNERSGLCSYSPDDTCGVCGVASSIRRSRLLIKG